MTTFTRDPPIPISSADEVDRYLGEDLILQFPRNSVQKPLHYDPVFPAINVSVGIAPYVTNQYPPDGANVLPNQQVSFDVISTASTLPILAVNFQEGTYEFAYDGFAFAPRYAKASRFISQIGGFHVVLVRSDGWIGIPRFSSLL